MGRVEVRPEVGRPEVAEPGDDCELFRDWLAGLALGLAGVGPSTPARHARSCRACDAFADDVAACRRWLCAPPSPRAPADDAVLDRALIVQLRARLARDLLRRARRETAREREAIHDDLARWRWLAARAHGDVGVASSVRGLARVTDALSSREVGRPRLLALAARLDPFGLDIALAWIGWLLHAGRRARADRFADRLADELPERGG